MIFLVIGGIWVLLGFLRLAVVDVTLGVITLVIAALFFFEYFWFGKFGITATPQGVTLHGYTTRQFAWHEIASIGASRGLARRTVLRLTNGSKKRARAPMHYWSMPDPHFDEKIAALQQWHQYFSGGPQQARQAPQGRYGGYPSGPQQPRQGVPAQAPPPQQGWPAAPGYGQPGYQQQPPQQGYPGWR